MIWAQLLVTGTVDQQRLLRTEDLAAENRNLKAQIKGRLWKDFISSHRDGISTGLCCVGYNCARTWH